MAHFARTLTDELRIADVIPRLILLTSKENHDQPSEHMTDLAEWGTTVGTLVLAGATFVSIRSSNRSARIAERALLAGQRPLLVVARREDPAQEIQFADGRVLECLSTQALFLCEKDVIYLATPLRNAGSGLAQLQGYRLDPEQADRVQSDPLGTARHRRGGQAPDSASFIPQQRDLYVASGETGFWQAALRDPSSPSFKAVQQALDTRGRLTVDLLYGDLEEGQRTITRFVLLPNADGSWRCDVAHHWRTIASNGP